MSPDEPPQQGYPWHPSPVPAYAGWWFKGTTSSDEIVGHMLTFSLYYKLVAKTPADFARVRSLVSDLMNHIVDHNFTLVGVSGISISNEK